MGDFLRAGARHHPGTSFNLIVLSAIEILSIFLLFGVILLYPIRWLPHIHPNTIWLVKLGMMGSYVVLRLLSTVVYNRRLSISKTLLIPAILLLVPFILYRFNTYILTIIFGILISFHLKGRTNTQTWLIKSFVIWVSIISLWGLLVTYIPISGFEPVAYPWAQGESFSTYFNNERIVPNTFGFSVRDWASVPTSTALIFSVVYWRSNQENSQIYSSLCVILFLQLVNIYLLTGSGRTGFVLIIFGLIVVILKKVERLEVLPLFVISPLVLWLSVYIYITFFAPNPVLIRLDEFMSHRLSLYMDSIRIISRNPSIIVGLGTSPYGEYALSELNIGQDPLSYGSVLTRPHNFIFEMIIEYGLIVGLLVIYWCKNLAQWNMVILRHNSRPTRDAVGIVLVGWIFTGFAVGRMGPIVGKNSTMFWWLCFGIFLAMVIKFQDDKQ